MIMSDLFGSEFTHFLPICYTGFAFSALIWPNIASVIANPQNIPPNEPHVENGITVMYFNKEIVGDFQHFLVFQLVVHVGLLVTLALFFRDSKLKKGKLSVVLNKLSKGELKHVSIILQHEKLKQEITQNRLTRISIDALKNVSFINSISKTYNFLKKSRTITEVENSPNLQKLDSMKEIGSVEHEPIANTRNELESPLLELVEIKRKDSQPQSPTLFPLSSFTTKKLERDFSKSIQNPSSKIVKHNLTIEQKAQMITEYKESQKSAQNTAKALLFHQNFLLIFLICVVRTTTSRYYMSNFKIIGLFYFHDDMLINTIGSMVFGGYILMTFTFGYIYDFLGLRASYKWIFILYSLGNLFYALAPTDLFMFASFSFVQRVRLLVPSRVYFAYEFSHYLWGIWRHSRH